jgi:hypothetical protein
VDVWNIVDDFLMRAGSLGSRDFLQDFVIWPENAIFLSLPLLIFDGRHGDVVSTLMYYLPVAIVAMVIAVA